MKFRILVTGGAGYLGSIMIPKFLKEGYEVTVLDNFIFSQSTLLDSCIEKKFHVIKGDCRDEDIIKNVIKDKDIIIPLAALVGAPICNCDKIAAQTTNYEAIKLLLKHRSNNQRIIYPCTNSGYGIGEAGKFCTEETPMRPISLYGRSKVEAEKAILDAGNCITFRLATVFGMSPRMRIDLLVNEFVYRAVYDKTVVIFEGNAKRNYIHIRDVAKAFLMGINNFDIMKNEPYNVGLSDANLSKLELCATIKKYIPGFIYLEAPIGKDPDQRDYIVSNEKIEKKGFKPDYSLEDGILELIKGYTMIKNNVYGNI